MPHRWLANYVHLALADYRCTQGCMVHCTGMQSIYPLLFTSQQQYILTGDYKKDLLHELASPAGEKACVYAQC